jgi:hypothetical protein
MPFFLLPTFFKAFQLINKYFPNQPEKIVKIFTDVDLTNSDIALLYLSEYALIKTTDDELKEWLLYDYQRCNVKVLERMILIYSRESGGSQEAVHYFVEKENSGLGNEFLLSSSGSKQYTTALANCERSYGSWRSIFPGVAKLVRERKYAIAAQAALIGLHVNGYAVTQIVREEITLDPDHQMSHSLAIIGWHSCGHYGMHKMWREAPRDFRSDIRKRDPALHIAMKRDALPLLSADSITELKDVVDRYSEQL